MTVDQRRFVEIRLEARVGKRRNQRVEDVGHGAADGVGCRQRPWVGLILERTMSKELQLGEDVVGGGRGVQGLKDGIVVIGRHGDAPGRTGRAHRGLLAIT